ncbi:AraC family transcriptional regulator [Aurantibacillus circumpalustris]|uniref:AraC family transcriptional regulator n=1 Tax=Aurantibacillus circumpalustris TaxID=3036359 RepID=UPI00295BACE1|nr:helix-turn-helix domain-containing protein [Aurantibacillus circumpalustris]
MKKIKNIPTLQNDGFKIIMSYYDDEEYSKKNINDFYIHGLSDDTYELKMPLPPHRQFNHSLILVTKGSIIASSGFDDYTIEQNAMIVVPAGQITSLSFMSDDIEGFYLHFKTDYLSHTDIDFSDWLTQPVIKFDKTETKQLVSLLNRMQKLNEDETNKSIIKLYLTTLLAEMKQSNDFRMRVNFPAHERITLEFKKLLNYNITKHSAITFYAEELNVTPNHLNKSVKATIGKSASSLINEMLILEAKILMQKSDMAIGEVASETGFEDVSYFGRFFKKHTGHTPKEYRKMIELSE